MNKRQASEIEHRNRKGTLLFRHATIILLSCIALGVAGAIVLPEGQQGESEPSGRGELNQPPHHASESDAAEAPKLVGFAINLHRIDDDQLDDYLAAIDRLHKLGVNAVEIVTPAWQQNGASDTITLDKRGCPTREQLLAVLKHARKRGMRTILMPIVLFIEPRDGEWRGKITPDDWNQWWHSYTQIVDHFHEVAIEADVSILVVGSELLSTEKQTRRWESLIKRCRTRKHPRTGERFRGKLTYSTNWDHYFKHPALWQHLDYIAMNAYWDLTTEAKDTSNPTDAELQARWQSIQKEVLGFAERHGKPLLITELGYPKLKWALKDSWEYTFDGSPEPSPQTQSRAYRSFLKAWGPLLKQSTQNKGSSTRQAQLRGVIFYEWKPIAHDDGGRTDYTVDGQPAMKVIEQWLSERDR